MERSRIGGAPANRVFTRVDALLRCAAFGRRLIALTRGKLERLQKMIFSLQPPRAWTIDGFNSDQFSQGFSRPGLAHPGFAHPGSAHTGSAHPGLSLPE